MARALTFRQTVVEPAARAAFVERLRARRSHYRSASCHYWVFERAEGGGAFIEFIEAADAGTLRAANAAAPDPVSGPSIFHELEID